MTRSIRLSRAARWAATAAVLALAAAAGACISEQARRYFEIRLETLPARPLPAILATILVEDSAVEGLYNDYRIVYRVSPFELNYYSYEFWARNPGVLAGDAMALFLQERNVFRAVFRDPIEDKGDYDLRSRIMVVEEVDSPTLWFGRLAMEIKILESATGKVRVSRTFDRRSPLPAKRVGALPGVISEILGDELTKAVDELAGQLGVALR